MTKIEESIRELVLDQLGGNKKVTNRLDKIALVFGNDTEFSEVGIGSLDSVELTMNIEDKFNINIPDEVMDSLNTVNKLTKYLDSTYNIKNI